MSFGVFLIIAGCLLVVIEIQSLTFYLLAIAISCFVASAVTLHGGSNALTVATLGVTTLIGLPLAHYIRLKMKNSESDKISNDDVGHHVIVDEIDKSHLRVIYRGTVWTGMLLDKAQAVAKGDVLYILKREGNTLILSGDKPE